MFCRCTRKTGKAEANRKPFDGFDADPHYAGEGIETGQDLVAEVLVLGLAQGQLSGLKLFGVNAKHCKSATAPAPGAPTAT